MTSSPHQSDPLDRVATMLDAETGSTIAQTTLGLSPAAAMLALSDWAMHLASSPGKQAQLGVEMARHTTHLADYMARSIGNPDAAPVIEPDAQDRRFNDPAWKKPPFNLLSQSFLLHQQWWNTATTAINGVSRHHEDLVTFGARQMLDMLAPTNFIATNPVLQRRIVETRGKCLIDGMKYLLEDIRRQSRKAPPAGTEQFVVGQNVATAKGKVVFRNRLIELIQYEPTTDTVRPEPVLIVPAWIMKYYILDLSPENSLVRWLTGQGYTVFMISWHNPDVQDQDLCFDDYRQLGPMAALDAVSAITGAPKIHAAGYCLGGTLLSIVAAAMARDGDERLASVTLLAAETEFREPGDLGLFIDDAQLHVLDNMMQKKGFLDSGQMGGAFQMLRTNDLVWSRILTTYLMGERGSLNDLMAWNADGTRMPAAMHSEYLRTLFLNNDLAEGRFKVDGRTINLSAIRCPMFVVGTERDHVAPWPSVYKIHLLTGTDITFTLTTGGHNAGIVSEPGHPRRYYQMLTRETDGLTLEPAEWRERAARKEGSWWTSWGQWLDERSGQAISPPPMGAPAKGYKPLADAPGYYVLEQ